MDRIVLADAGPLIFLAQISGGLSWLRPILGRVAITSAVRGEVLPPQKAPGKSRLLEAVRVGILYQIENIPSGVQLPHLGRGEASVIQAAMGQSSLGKSCLVIMDDRAGRNALRRIAPPTVQLTGTAAIVGRAKEMRLIPSAAAVFDELRRKGFYVSQEIVQAILKEVGEPIAPEKSSKRTDASTPRSRDR